MCADVCIGIDVIFIDMYRYIDVIFIDVYRYIDVIFIDMYRCRCYVYRYV